VEQLYFLTSASAAIKVFSIFVYAREVKEEKLRLNLFLPSKQRIFSSSVYSSSLTFSNFLLRLCISSFRSSQLFKSFLLFYFFRFLSFTTFFTFLLHLHVYLHHPNCPVASYQGETRLGRSRGGWVRN
jgi:hypothetical protein